MNSSRTSSPLLTLNRLVAVVALLVAPLLGGCIVVAAGAGAGAVAWVRGELTSSVPHDLDQTFAATQRALAAMDLAKISDHKTGLDAQLVSRTALDKRVEIKLERVSDKLTKVRIRVGVIGDEALSLAILDKVKAELN